MNKLNQTMTRSLAAHGAAALTVMTALVAVVEAGKKW
jgi:hypothetical protein